MAKKILIDMVKLRDYPECKPDGVCTDGPFSTEFKSVREFASFYFTCRKCSEAPCMAVCPVEALEKDGNGVITRALNLCIRCKSCITICPFGTLMDDLFEKKGRENFFDLGDEEELTRFAGASPGQAVTIYEGGEDPGQHIYELTDRIFIRDYIWNP